MGSYQIYRNLSTTTVHPRNPITTCDADQLLSTKVSQAIAIGKDDQALTLLQFIINELITNYNTTITQTCQSNLTTLTNAFIQILTLIIQHSYLSTSTSEQLAFVLVNLVTELKANLDTNVVIPILNIIQILIQEVGKNPIVGTQMLQVLNNVLEIGECKILDDTMLTLTILTQAMLSSTLPEEDSIVTDNYIYSVISGKNIRLHSDTSDNVPITLDTLNFTIPSELLAQGGLQNFVDLSIVRYNSASLKCRITSAQVPAGEIVTITLSDNLRSAISVFNLSIPIKFYLPLNSTYYEEEQKKQQSTGVSTCGSNTKSLSKLTPSCAWWNPNTNDWEGSGCTTNGIPFWSNTSTTSELVILCECTHLTEFTVLLKLNEECIPTLTTEMKVSYLVFAALYLVVAVIGLWQVIRLLFAGSVNRSIILQHSLIFIVGILRTVTNFLFAGYVWHISLPILGLISALPYLGVFWIYTLMVFQWAAVYHLAMKKGHAAAFRRVQPFFIVSNILVIIVIVLVFLSIINSKNYLFALIGSIIMATITTICGIAFLIYGSLLAFEMKGAANAFVSGGSGSGPVQPNTPSMSRISSTHHHSLSRPEIGEVDVPKQPQLPCWERFVRCMCCSRIFMDGVEQNHETPLWIRMMTSAIVVATCFIGESVMWVLSITSVGDTWGGLNIVDVIYTSAFYTFDIIALLAVLFIFRRMIKQEVLKQVNKLYPHSKTQCPSNNRGTRSTQHQTRVGDRDGSGDIDDMGSGSGVGVGSVGVGDDDNISNGLIGSGSSSHYYRATSSGASRISQQGIEMGVPASPSKTMSDFENGDIESPTKMSLQDQP